MNKPHVAITCPDCGGAGSVASVACHHARELALYFEITLISDTLPSEKVNNVDYVKSAHHQYSYLRRYSHVLNEYSFVRSVRRQLEKIHKKNPIDMVMCHGHALAALAADYLKNRYKIPYVLIAHGDVFDRPRGTYDWRLTAFYRAVTPSAYRNADLVIALSPYMASCALKQGASPDAVHNVPNGIESDDIGVNPKLLQQKPVDIAFKKHLNLLFVGSLNKIKGIDILIDACKILHQKDVKFKLRIIGKGCLDGQIRNDIKRACMSSQICLQGAVQRLLLGDYYCESDIVCVPSINDPLPTVVLEALVSGVPVIASDTGGIPYMINNGFNGILIPPGNPEALANAVEILYRYPKKLSELANNAHTSVFPRFSWKHIGRQLYQIITLAISLGNSQ
jgi:glycosyltransferase involved in cell wall biosynthesis